MCPGSPGVAVAQTTDAFGEGLQRRGVGGMSWTPRSEGVAFDVSDSCRRLNWQSARYT